MENGESHFYKGMEMLMCSRYINNILVKGRLIMIKYNVASIKNKYKLKKLTANSKHV